MTFSILIFATPTAALFSCMAVAGVSFLSWRQGKMPVLRPVIYTLLAVFAYVQIICLLRPSDLAHVIRVAALFAQVLTVTALAAVMSTSPGTKPAQP